MNLDRVSDEIGDDLPEPQRISRKLIWDPRIDVVDEIELVLGSLDAESLEDSKDGGSERERDLFHRHSTGFD